MEKLKITILIFLLCHDVSGEICGKFMLLQHNLINLQPIPSTFEVQVPKSVKSGEEILIKIKGLKNVKGLLVQASSLENDDSIGEFFGSMNIDHLSDCLEASKSSAIYQIDSENNFEISWKAPTTQEPIDFRFILKIIKSSSDLYQPFITDTIRVETESDNELDFIYDGCGSQKVCYGIPDNCVISRGCNLFGSVELIDGDFDFELMSMENQNYIALGVSQSQHMANTSNVECIQEVPGVIIAYTSWMSPPRAVARSGVDQTIIKYLEGRIINNRIYCKVRRDSFSIVNDHIIDLENDKHFLLIAGGIQLRPDSVGSHGPNRGFTSEMISLLPSDLPAPPTAPPTTTPPSDESIYDGCGVTKLCFGTPDGCISTENCKIVATSRKINSEYFEFEMLSSPVEYYVALGISQTRSMGDASVIECTHSAGGISAFASWNYALDNSREDVNQNFIKLLESRVIDGRIYCKIQREIHSIVRGESFHLENEPHYLLIASGVAGFNSVGPHTYRDYSNEKVWLAVPGEVQGAPISALLLTHGSLMIIAWIGFTSIGIVIARYYKPMWKGKQMFGKDLWFAWHVCCLSLAWILTLIGFIIIFVDLGVWRTTTHSILGCIVFTLATLQVIGGSMRPDPKAENRRLFNWMHQALGNVIHLLAVLCIFYAVPLPAARLPHYTIYILVGFVSYYFLIHFMLMTNEIQGKIKMSKREKENLPIPSKPSNSSFKICSLGIYIVAIAAFVIGLILIFTLGL